MIATTLDPISLNDVTDTENAPYLVEGEGQKALKIYFEGDFQSRDRVKAEAGTAMIKKAGRAGINSQG
ncbi:MAG: hypothetical protein WBP44_08015 [Gammaproteobacteria bacterium]|jgi:hypothetical protein